MKKWLVKVPVTDLRRNPSPSSLGYAKDPLQESQLLFGECAVGDREQNGWIFVEAVEQKKWTLASTWDGYPGWVQKKDLIEVSTFPKYNLAVRAPWTKIFPSTQTNGTPLLSVSFGTRLMGEGKVDCCWWQIRLPNASIGFVPDSHVQIENKDQARENITTLGKNFLGFPYLWGGRSSFCQEWKESVTSVDCSGLVNLLYRVQGIDIPRDAHDQFLASRRIDLEQLKPADLIFRAEIAKPNRMSHVMLYVGNGEILEATILSQNVRQIPIKNLNIGRNEKYIFFFGTFL